MPRHRLIAIPRARRPFVESLEGRALLSTVVPKMHHDAPAIHVNAHQPVAHHLNRLSKVRPHVGGNPPTSALTAAQTRHIYGFDQIANLGDGQTIAIVDAYDDPNIAADADYFDSKMTTTLGGSTTYLQAYGSASTWLTKAYASGRKPAPNRGWAGEIALDVEWAHAIAPKAQILLVEAASASYANLMTAIDYAAAHGAAVISNSWGGSEFSGETSYDSKFLDTGITYVFSAGDSGNQSYPAVSPNVVSVGGTTLGHDSSNNWSSESAWSSGGGGMSSYEAKPTYQSSLSYAKRANPDISYDADPNTGFAVYDSYGSGGWAQYGGTSAGSPQISALIALSNQGRAALSTPKAALTGYNQTLPALYAMTSDSTGTATLYDVTTGKNSVGSAGVGYDLATGKGTPRNAAAVYNALVSY